MPTIISANLNGIRSASKKGFFDWMQEQDADFVCVQELKAQAADMSAEMLAPAGYHGNFHYARKERLLRHRHLQQGRRRMRCRSASATPNSMPKADMCAATSAR